MNLILLYSYCAVQGNTALVHNFSRTVCSEVCHIVLFKKRRRSNKRANLSTALEYRILQVKMEQA